MKTKYLKIMMLLAVFLTFPVLSHAVDVKITFVIGKVEFKKSDESDWKSAKKDLMLTDKDMIRTGSSSTVMIEVENTLKMKLTANTTLKLESLFPKATVSFSGGKVWVDLAKMQKNQSFNIRTPSSLIGVRGTEFIYENGENEDRVIVYEGLVGFGKDANNQKDLPKGKMGILRGSEIIIKDFNHDDDKDFKRGFPIIIGKDDSLDSLSRRERFRFRNEVRRELSRLDYTRNIGRTKYMNDITTGKTLTVDGEVVRVQQYLRKTGDNKIQIVNITSKTNFINVMEYIGLFASTIPNTLSELIKVTQTSNPDIWRRITMIQRDLRTTGNDGKLIIEEDKKNGYKLLIGGASTYNGTVILTDFASGGYSHVKLQRLNPTDTFLTALYKDGTGSVRLTLRVTPVDKDGNPVMVASTDGVDLNTLSSMSFKVEFFGPMLGSTILYGVVLSDIGLILINQ